MTQLTDAGPSRWQGVSRREARLSTALIVVAIVLLVVPTPAALVDRVFTNGLYPFIQSLMTGISNFVPVSLGEILVIVFLLVALAILLRGVLWPRANLVTALVRVPTMFAAAYIVFTLLWGLNYRRVPIIESLRYHADRVTGAALDSLAERVVAELNAIHPHLPASWPEWSMLRDSLGPSFHRATAALGATWKARTARPKRSLGDAIMRKSGVDGYILAYFGEIMTNSSHLPFERVETVAHEWGHLAGWANESEASYVAWLTGMYGPIWARYSVLIENYATIVTQLPRDVRGFVHAKLDAGPRRDLEAMAERVRRDINRTASRVQTRVNDRYLRANRVAEGVGSYSLVVRLMLGVDIPIPPLELTRR